MAVWLGTRFTMEQEYFKRGFTESGIEIIVPDEKERIFIDWVIAEAVIMGCTELSLMYAGEKLPVPVFDTMECHIQGIVDYMFKE